MREIYSIVDELTVALEKEKRVVISHSLLMAVAELLGYEIYRNGLCYGIAYMGMQAILSEDIHTFDKRLARIALFFLSAAQCGSNEMSETIKVLKNESVDFYEFVYMSCIEKIFKQPFPEKINFKAFLDGVMLYQNPDRYPAIFQKPVHGQEVDLVLPLMTPINLDVSKKGGIQKFESCFHIFSLREFTDFLSTIQKDIDSVSSEPVALVVSGVDNEACQGHSITIGYHPKNKIWHFIGANKLPSETIKYTAQIADKVFKMFGPKVFELSWHQDHAILQVSPFGLHCETEKLSKLFKLLRQKMIMNFLKPANNKWFKKYKKNSRGETLLHFVVRANRHESLEWLKQFFQTVNPYLKGECGFLINHPEDVACNTVMHYAVKMGDMAICKLLIDNGGDIDKQNELGNSPLDCSEKLASWLLHYSKIHKNRAQRTALDQQGLFAGTQKVVEETTERSVSPGNVFS